MTTPNQSVEPFPARNPEEAGNEAANLDGIVRFLNTRNNTVIELEFSLEEGVNPLTNRAFQLSMGKLRLFFDFGF